MTVNMHYLCHVLLFQCTYIFAGEYRRLLATHHLQGDCIQANVNKIVELNMCLLCRSIQSSFHDRQWYPFVHTGTETANTIMKAVFSNHIFDRIS